ncbi:hypothetical protein FrEUN1fDRAFT_6546, partial [Parafrankia sp. EUN1f]
AQGGSTGSFGKGGAQGGSTGSFGKGGAQGGSTGSFGKGGAQGGSTGSFGKGGSTGPNHAVADGFAPTGSAADTSISQLLHDLLEFSAIVHLLGF